MKNMPNGMSTYHGQEKDRANWQRSMDRRNELVKEIRRRKIKTPKKPHEMKIRDLEKLLVIELEELK